MSLLQDSDPHRNSVFVSTLIDVNHFFASRFWSTSSEFEVKKWCTSIRVDTKTELRYTWIRILKQRNDLHLLVLDSDPHRNSVFVSTLIDVHHFFTSNSDPHRNSVFVSTLIDERNDLHLLGLTWRQNYDIRGSESWSKEMIYIY
jgi:hypothetical protein